MKLVNRVVTTALIGTLVLSGCSSKSQNSESVSTPQQSSVTTKPKLDLSIFIDGPANSSLPADTSKDFVRKTIEEKFNVNLKVTYMVTDTPDYNTKLNALMASGETPDMWKDGNADGGLKYNLDGLLADVSKFVSPATMPNYYKYWTNEAEIKRYNANYPHYRNPIPFDRKVYRSYYVRKDWLDKLNLKMPTTYEEYYNVLRAFRNNDPDGNGKKDTYGFTTAGNGTSPSLEWPEWIKNGLTYALFVENNKFIDMQSDLRFEKVADDIVQLIKEDLVDPDWFLNKGPQVEDKAIQGKVGVVLGNSKNFAYDSNPQSIQVRSKAINPKAEWQPFVPFVDTPLATSNLPGSPFLIPKTTAEKSPEKVARIIEILDWLSSQEGFLLTHYGLEGKHYKKDGNNISLLQDAITNDIIKQGDFLKIWDFFTPNTPETFGLTVVDPNETDRDRGINKFLLSIPVRDNIGTNVTPPTGFDLAAFRSKMREYQVKLIMDEKSGKNYPKYYQELMTVYGGEKMFKAYEEQMKAVGMIK